MDPNTGEILAISSRPNFDAVNYKDVKLQDKFVLVLGNEGQGVKEETILLASDICKIEMSNIDSLNVGVAGGILMNEYR